MNFENMYEINKVRLMENLFFSLSFLFDKQNFNAFIMKNPVRKRVEVEKFRM